MSHYTNSRACLPSSISLPGASPLRRSGCCLSLSDLAGASQTQSSPYSSVHRFINHGKLFEISSGHTTKRSTSLTPLSKTSPNKTHRRRTSSPLSPTQQVLPPRPAFPRSKPEPDLYKMAIKTRMRSSHDEQKIFTLGSPLVTSVLNATVELEGIVGRDGDCDIGVGGSDDYVSF